MIAGKLKYLSQYKRVFQIILILFYLLSISSIAVSSNSKEVSLLQLKIIKTKNNKNIFFKAWDFIIKTMYLKIRDRFE